MSTPTPETPPPGPPPEPLGSKDERMWAMFCHLSTLAGYVIIVPGINVIAPLIVWMIKKEEYPLVNDQGKEAINFQINILIYVIVSALLICATVGFFLLPVVVIYSLVMTIIAALKANQGEYYRYPLTIRFLR